MQQTRTDPPYIPLRARGWPTRRVPRWALAALAALLAIGIAVALVHRPSRSERAADLRGLVQTMKADVGSCAAGVREALTLLRNAAASTTPAHRSIALGEVNYGASNCSPANNEELDALTSLQVPESLSSYHLGAAVAALIDWAAPNAIRVQSDVARALADYGKPAEAADLAAVHLAVRKLDAQRSAFYADLRPAIKALSPGLSPPALSG